MAQVEQITIQVESTGFFDGWIDGAHGIDTAATLARFADTLAAQLADVFPGAGIDVDVLPANQFTSRAIRIDYTDGERVESGDGLTTDDFLVVESILYRVGERGEEWAVDIDPDA